MNVIETAIPDVKIIEPRKFGDRRGFFSETYNKTWFDNAMGHEYDFVQDNHSLSGMVGTVRGLHFQRLPTPQDKLVRVTRGAVLDVAVDIRYGSPTFGQHVAAELSADNWRQLWVPVGFAHGFITRLPDTEVVYKVTGFYSPDCDGGITWNDPALGIDWGADHGDVVLSEKDGKLPTLADLPVLFTYNT
jgi:dTDP-4-dehydrorhamnose 3,5-epimerase